MWGANIIKVLYVAQHLGKRQLCTEFQPVKSLAKGVILTTPCSGNGSRLEWKETGLLPLSLVWLLSSTQHCVRKGLLLGLEQAWL